MGAVGVGYRFQARGVKQQATTQTRTVLNLKVSLTASQSLPTLKLY